MKFLQNLFQTVTNNLIYSKTAIEKNNLSQSKIGGVQGRYDRGQRFNGFFLDPFPNSTPRRIEPVKLGGIAKILE